MEKGNRKTKTKKDGDRYRECRSLEKQPRKSERGLRMDDDDDDAADAHEE